MTDSPSTRNFLASTKEAAAILSIKEQTLRKWACSGTGPIRPVHVGRLLRWRMSDINALIEGHSKLEAQNIRIAQVIAE